jgi:DNA mismatch repair protein MutL
MLGRIRILDDALCDQIAAGEVVERPASVVKELLENAVDAGATRVQVEIEDGGCAAIRVVDDGSGMSPEDARLSLRRHATSKLRSFEDLQAIDTLGFRGEALPSIASVSRLRLRTRERDALSGLQLEVDGGDAPRVSEIGCAPGTTVEVRDLFFNVPARLKFLKSRPTESGHIAAVCTRVALARPELALTLTSEGRVVRQFARASSFSERVQSVCAGEMLVAFELEQAGISLQAALGAPERARNGAAGLHLFVNGRPVRDPSLARAVAYAYGSVLPPGKYPVGALRLRLPAEQVDVNVHPQKQEVRFRDGRAVFDAVTRMLARRLGTSAWSGPARRAGDYWDARLRGVVSTQPGTLRSDGAALRGEEISLAGGDPWGLGAGGASTDRIDPALDGALSVIAEAAGPAMNAPGPPAAATAPAQRALTDAGFFGALRVLAQVRRMLLVCEGEDALYVLDQHAADERVRFDRLQRAYRSRDVKTQRLLFPERVHCTEVEAALCESHGEDLQQVGLECALLGPDTIAVHTVPALLSRASPARLLRDLLGELERAGGRAFSAAVDRALATMACHGAIRAGDLLSIEQAQALLRNLDQVADFGGHCPHGRPVVHTIPLDDLERRLGR